MNASIGNNCIIHSNVVIYDGVEIGDDVIIHAGTVIGHSGLGCERDQYGSLHKFPHYSNVIIGPRLILALIVKLPKAHYHLQQ